VVGVGLGLVEDIFDGRNTFSNFAKAPVKYSRGSKRCGHFEIKYLLVIIVIIVITVIIVIIVNK